MSESNEIVPSWNSPGPWTAKGREVAHIKRNADVEATKSLTRAELSEIDAQLRKRYTENRVYDLKDVMSLALSLSDGDL